MSYSNINREAVLEALKRVSDPETGESIVDAGRVSSIIIRERNIGFAIEVADNASGNEALRRQCEAIIANLPGAGKVTVVLTAHNPEPTKRQQKEQLKEVRKEQKLRMPPQPVEGVTHIIAVASGKGGVGKSTTAVNLAVALAGMGIRTGLLDADIYGPSIPLMMGLKEKPAIQDNKMVPPVAYGVQCISMGMLVAEGAALAWRGSMATKALTQLFRGTLWDNIEVLVVDMPPGTGDVHISLAENFPVSGAIIVSTPQEVALLDAEKAVDMFAKVNIPVIGLVENMSWFEDPINNNRSYIFGQGGVEKLARARGLEVLIQLPMMINIREGGDNGVPVATKNEENSYRNLAEVLMERFLAKKGVFRNSVKPVG